jgi:hypothetical protein
MFCAKKGEIESHQLPPCQDCLTRHILRANYQTAIWKRSTQGTSPVGRGWQLNEGTLAIHWMAGRPAPEAVLDLLSCSCARKCDLQNCQCLKNGLRCTDMCRLQTCGNQQVDDEEKSPFDDEEDYAE